jgi:FtsH-binding integral membrane protein
VAILAFVALETLLLKVLDTDEIMRALFGHPASILIVFGGFMLVAWLANSWALSGASQALQYVGLALYVVCQVVIFLPILYIASRYSDPSVIPTAGILTLGLFGGLTVAVFTTRKDFSFLGPILSIACFIALGVIIAGWIFGFTPGLFFAFVMVALACGFILYDTSNVIHHYRTDQHVAAALALFASVALLFMYILRILMATSRNN